MALGYTADDHLLLVRMTGGVTFAREALVMKTLGCVGALNLDATDKAEQLQVARDLFACMVKVLAAPIADAVR